jgi:hypothetical protein
LKSTTISIGAVSGVERMYVPIATVPITAPRAACNASDASDGAIHRRRRCGAVREGSDELAFIVGVGASWGDTIVVLPGGLGIGSRSITVPSYASPRVALPVKGD